MRKALFILCLIIASSLGMEAKTVSASDPSVTFVGRVQRQADGSVRYDWTGVYLRTSFSGNSIKAVVAEDGESWHNVYVDGKLVQKLCVKGKEPHEVTLADKLSKGSHSLVLQKVTEGEYGLFTISSLTASGDFKAVPAKKRFIEFIGDSYTCGYGTEGANEHEHFKLSTENLSQSYACLLSRYFDADYSVIAHSGMGVVRNFNGKTMKTMSDRYLQVFDDHDAVPYNFDQYHPDLVVIALGTNDFSVNGAPSNFVDKYVSLIKTVRQHNGEVPILCVIPHSANIYLMAAMESLASKVNGMKAVAVTNPMADVVRQADLGSDYHPNWRGQQKVAMMLIPQVASFTGWQLRDNPF